MDEITIRDVAKVAGVSHSTVSRILNNKTDVAETTRQRVLEVIAQLNYKPHAQAQRLATGRSHAIALLHPDQVLRRDEAIEYLDFVVMGFMLGVAKAGGEHSYFFNFLTDEFTEADLLSLYRSAQVDGVILMQTREHDWRVDLLQAHRYPFVMIGRCADNTGLDYVDVCFEVGALKVFDFLVRLGHQRIGFLTLAEAARRAGYVPAVNSWLGYQAALRQHGLEAWFREVGIGAQAVYAATLSLLDQQPELTAIVNFNPGSPPNAILDALKQRGKQVPDDIAVVSFEPDKVAELVRPRLTALNFPSYEMGYQAARMLIHKLDGNPVSESQVLIEPQLVIRDTTGPARNAG